ncbi:MAG: WG repeat-containing protein [Spirochaetes bacterium]|nr:WG repeat-containing protein [Spirochaetota bacterium]
MKFSAWAVLVCALAGLDAADITAYHQEHFGDLKYNKWGVAHIVTSEGWVAIDKNKKLLYTPFIFDNGPDYVKEGLLRFVENGKMGFVNEGGKKVIPAQFDFVFPFEGGTARFCNGCKSVSDGEHKMMDEKTGTWGKINKSGKKLP